LVKRKASVAVPAREEHAAQLRVIGIGASAGGLDAFPELLEHLPADTGMAFVMVQHLAPDQKSMLPEILSRSTAMPVQTGRAARAPARRGGLREWVRRSRPRFHDDPFNRRICSSRSSSRDSSIARRLSVSESRRP